MCAWAGGVVELIDVKRATLFDQLAGTGDGSVDVGAGNLTRYAFDLIDEDDFRAQRLHLSAPRRAVAARHHRDERMTHRGANDGEAGAHVAAGHFDNGLSR